MREDGYVFRTYDSRGYEQWMSPEACHNNRVGRTLRHAKERSSAKGLPFDIDQLYLLSIFPSDGLCPALRAPLVWGTGINDNTPALDRGVPALGYVRGNVSFISTKANNIKSNATTEEIFAVAQYLKDKS